MSLILFYIILFLLLIIIGRVMCKDWLYPGNIFCAFWLFVYVAYIISYYCFEFYSVSITTINIIGIGVIIFYITSYAIKNITIVHRSLFNKKPNIKLLELMLLFAIVMASILAKRCMLMRKMGYDSSYIRSLYGSINSYGPIRSPLESITYSYFLRPMVYCDIAILPVELLRSKKNNRLILLLLGLLAISSTDAGRVTYYNLIVAILICYLWMKKYGTEVDIKYLNKNKKIIYILVTFLIIVMVAISNMRGIDTNKLLEQFISYFSGCIPFMDINLAKLNDLSKSTYGLTFFGGVLKFIFWVTTQFGYDGGQIWDIVVNYGSVQLQYFTKIGSRTDYNAFVSAFYYFYMDAGLGGVIIGSSIWSILSVRAYHKMRYSKDTIWIYVYILIIIGIMNSMVRWPFFQGEYVFAFIYLAIISLTGQIKDEN